VETQEEDLGMFEHGDKRILMHGQIQHGFQYQGIAWRRSPTSYFGEMSGIGLAINELRNLATAETKRFPTLRVGVVGLGVGTIAAYGRSGDYFRFYEINPQVCELADKYFSFLRDSAAETAVVVGDARIMMEREIKANQSPMFDILAIDAFSSDSIPVHLLTTQCAETYRQLLRPGGVLAIHISNRFVDLQPITRSIANQLNCSAVYIPSKADPTQGAFSASWVLISYDDEFLQSQKIQEASSTWDDDRILTWTDDYSFIWKVITF
jgi:hypothetical protein